MAQRPHYSNNTLGRTGATQEDIDDFQQDRFDEEIVASIRASQDQYENVTQYARQRPLKYSSRGIGVEIDPRGSVFYGSQAQQIARSSVSRELNKFGSNVAQGTSTRLLPDVLLSRNSPKLIKLHKDMLKHSLLREQINNTRFTGNSLENPFFY